MKNCGEDFQSEVFTKSFMDAMKTIIKVSTGYAVRYTFIANVFHLA